MVQLVPLVTLLVVGHSGHFTKTNSKVMVDHTVSVRIKSLILSNVKLLEWDIGLNGRTGQVVLSNVPMEFQKV